MGGSQSKIVCDSCRIIYGSTPVLEIYHQGVLGNKFLCVNCFEMRQKNRNIPQNHELKACKCNFCSNTNLDNLKDHYFKIHWNGKYNKMIMCEKCLFNRKK